MKLISTCMQTMRRQGVDQWDENYPNAEVVSKDVENHSVYALQERRDAGEKFRCVAAMSLNEEQHPAYQTLNWAGPARALVVHRLCVHPDHQRLGIANRMMEFAERHARQLRYASIRLDTYSGNPPALQLYARLGYHKVGEVYFRGKIRPFFCFEKIISPGTAARDRSS